MRRPRADIVSVAALAALVVATAVTFDSLLTTAAVPAYRDLLFFTLPFKAFLAERLRRGELPLWNPLILMGTPFLGNLQSGVFYPPSVLLLIPLPLGFNLFLFAHYVIAITGTWAWLRARALSNVAACVGASVFALGGYLVSLMNLTNHLQSAAWAPWVFWAWTFYRNNRSSKALAGFVVFVCIELLGGSPECLLLTLVVVFAETAYLHRSSRLEALGLEARIAGAGVLVIGICAIQVLPTLECVGQSDRAGALSFAEVMKWSFRPVALLQLLFPHSSALLPRSEGNSLGPGFEHTLALIQSPYLGIGGLCLGIVGCARGRERGLWVGLVVGAMLLALGDATPVLPWLYHTVPQIFGKFRYPEKFYFLVHVAAAVLAAEGAERVLRRDPGAERIAWTTIGTLFAVVAPLYVLRWWWPLDYLQVLAFVSGKYLPLSALVPLGLDTYWKVQRLILILAALATLLALRKTVLSDTTTAALLALVVIVDLVSVNRNLNLNVQWSDLDHRPLLFDATSARDSGARVFNYQIVSAAAPGARPEPRLTRWLHTIVASEDLVDTYGRLWETAYTNEGMLYGVGGASGGDGLERGSDRALLETLLRIPLARAVELLRIYGVGYLVGPDALSIEGLAEIPAGHATPYHAYRVADPAPLVRAVSRLRLAASPEEAMIQLSEPGFDGQTAFVEELPPGWKDTDGPTTYPVEILALRRSDELLEIHSNSERQSFLVVNESFFPGWEARLDGAPTRIYRADGIVRGVYVPAGIHTVVLEYRPSSLRAGAAISVTTIAAALALSAVARRRETRRMPEHPA